MPPPQRAKPARKSARCGVGDRTPCPHPPHPQPVGSGPRPHARNDECSGAGERPPRTPHTQVRGALPGTLMLPSQCAKPARKSARCGVGDGSPRPHPLHGERAAPSQVGGNWTGSPPPEQAKRSTGPRPDTRRGMDRVERPYQRPAPGPRGVRAPHQPREEGGGARTPRERERTHTQRAHGKNQRGNPTEPAERTDRMEWRTSERG